MKMICLTDNFYSSSGCLKSRQLNCTGGGQASVRASVYSQCDWKQKEGKDKSEEGAKSCRYQGLEGEALVSDAIAPSRTMSHLRAKQTTVTGNCLSSSVCDITPPNKNTDHLGNCSLQVPRVIFGSDPRCSPGNDFNGNFVVIVYS